MLGMGLERAKQRATCCIHVGHTGGIAARPCLMSGGMLLRCTVRGMIALVFATRSHCGISIRFYAVLHTLLRLPLVEAGVLLLMLLLFLRTSVFLLLVNGENVELFNILIYTSKHEVF